MQLCSTNGIFVTVALILSVATGVIGPVPVRGTAHEHVGRGDCHDERCIYSKYLQCQHHPPVTEHHGGENAERSMARQDQAHKTCQDDLKKLAMEFIKEHAAKAGKNVREWLDASEQVRYDKDTGTYYLVVRSTSSSGHSRSASVEIPASFYQPKLLNEVNGEMIYIDDPDRNSFSDQDSRYLRLSKNIRNPHGVGMPATEIDDDKVETKRRREERTEREAAEAAKEAARAAAKANKPPYVITRRVKSLPGKMKSIGLKVAQSRRTRERIISNSDAAHSPRETFTAISNTIKTVMKDQIKSIGNSIVQSPKARAMITSFRSVGQSPKVREAREAIKSLGNKMKSIFSGSLFRRGRRTSESNYSSSLPGTPADQPAATASQPVTPGDQPAATASQPVTPGDQPATTAGQQKARKTVTFQDQQ